jgi:hypothetical protein
VEVKQRTRKIIEILGYKEQKKETGRLFGILVPGGGHVYFGRLWIAFAVIFLMVSCFIYGFFWRLLPQGDMVIRAASWDARIWVIVPAMIVYLLSVVHLYRLRG